AQPDRGQLDVSPRTFWRRALFGKLRRRQMGDEVPDSLRALGALLTRSSAAAGRGSARRRALRSSTAVRAAPARPPQPTITKAMRGEVGSSTGPPRREPTAAATPPAP